MIRRISCLLVLASVSCTKFDKPALADEKTYGPTGIPPELRAKASGGSAGPAIPGANVPTQPAPLNITPAEDIVFTDPDNPDAGLPELSTLLAAPKRGPWEESETIAKQRASREGKPLLIWFTDSQKSPMCKALSEELFSTSEFEKWANEKIIRLRVDSYPHVDDPNISLGEKESRRVDLQNYVTNLKKRYKVLGHPSVLMLNPGGEVVGQYRGYQRGEAKLLWFKIKQGEETAAGAYKSWRAGLEKKGYREWQDRGGRKVFAKLASYSKGQLVFVEPDGTRSKTREERLSDADREWIAAQKKLRNLQ